MEIIHTTLGAEFGEDEGKTAIIIRALYGLKSSGASFRNHLADCMRMLGYQSCLADPDLWYKPMVQPSDGYKYYGYALLYTDHCPCINHNAEDEIKKLDKYFMMKKGSIGDPDFYLGAKIKPMRMPNGVTSWSMSSSKYIQEALRNCEKYLKDKCEGRTLTKRATNPFPTKYDPDLDETELLNPDLASFYATQIRVLRWIVELGQIANVATEVSLMSSHFAIPRQGHLDAVLHIMARTLSIGSYLSSNRHEQL